MRVLLTDGQQRKTLAAARSLGSRGVEVLVAEETRWAPALFSRYCRQALVSPHPGKQPELYWQWLLETWQRHRFDLLIPMDDASLAVVMRHQAELPARALLPPPDGYAVAADKARTVAAARALGIACPRSEHPQSWQAVQDLLPELRFPLVIKPRQSSGSRGITRVEHADQLLTLYQQVHARHPWPLLQEYIPAGDKLDVCLLYDRDSRLRAGFVQRELRCFPDGHGPSTLQESWRDPELLACADRLMRSLNWQGIAEVEFMVDPRNGRPQLMEINPRFWGSLACAIFAGVDFPWLYSQLALSDDCAAVTDYTIGQRCRWLLPGDLLHWLTSRHRWRLRPPLIGGRARDDILSWQDPGPTFGFLTACLHYLTDREMWQMIFQR